MPVNEYSNEQYRKDFDIENKTPKQEKALEHALDIRKFEIDLYWKRATYFWTFIGATFAGFIAVQASSINDKHDMSVFLSCLGIVFSFAWVCVNRGSKQWQENWEYHVDMLEDQVTGPLYKVVLTRNDPKDIKEKAIHYITGPSPLSVSKINQIISLYVTLLWACLLIYSLPPFDFSSSINWFYVSIISLSGIACISFVFLAKTYGGGYWHKATIRTAKIKNG